ncbi:hypothetical protein SLS62_005939 [Diatrype stigma]|uniref:LCCL domain-containing protein n=1 Tax=Diatrype stigma TaxID=117547 RepID=A0AAN9YSF0_9PEZI
MSSSRIPDRPISPDIEHQEAENRIEHSAPPITNNSPIRPAHFEYDEDGGDSSSSSSSSSANPSSSIPTPRFMQDEGPWKRWKWVPYSARRLGRAVAVWTRGPATGPPRVFRIEPVLPAVQRAPVRLLHRVLARRGQRAALYALWVVLWVVVFAVVMWRGQVSSEIPVWGRPSSISCTTVYWSRGNDCGLDGVDCRPFNGSGFAFRCPANCASVQVLNPRAVGAQEVAYRPFVIGGPPDPANNSSSDQSPVYRGDSFLCGSAIHAGVVSNQDGGCGVVQLVGTQQGYAASSQNGIDSIAFDSYFPKSFTFQQDVQCTAKDVRWPLLAITVVFTTLLSLFTASPGVFFFSTFIATFWEVGMASDPPSYSTVPALFSDILGKFLPAMFCAWVIYDKMGVRRTLAGLTAQVEKTVLWLGGCWVGALTNYTFDFIPIQRLTGHDLEQQPGAKAALAVIVVVLFAILVSQVWFFQQEGRLVRLLKLYGLLVLGIIICLVLPNVSLRIHHYVLALLLLPATAVQTRPALLYQGILVGLFVNGIARWGFDAVLQTSVALQGDAQLGSLLPTILAPVVNATGAAAPSITFRWNPPPSPQYDAISVLVNDVERFRGFFGDEGFTDEFVWTRANSSSINSSSGEGDGDDGSAAVVEYFRFAFMDGTSVFDYTKAGIWDADLNWVAPDAGASKIRRRGAWTGVGAVQDEEVRVPSALERRLT